MKNFTLNLPVISKEILEHESSNAALLADSGIESEDEDEETSIRIYSQLYKMVGHVKPCSDKLANDVDCLKISFVERKQELERLWKQFNSFTDDPKLKKLRNLL